ncbi:MAG: ubiquitin-conjugating enzyme E2 [Planctomycetota bacterium]
MSVRLLRLRSDLESVRRLAHLHPRIEVEGVTGNPPERYRLVLRVRSLREKGDKLVIVAKHRLEITMPHGYPRDVPTCRMLTPVFHPNIAPHAVCIGDHWSAAESLDLMIQRVGEMLAFQSYNVKSPLNGRAARWVEENLHRLPIDKEEFFLDISDVREAEAASSARGCANCGAEGASFASCATGHELCPDCAVHCATCGTLLCLVCGTTRCVTCAGPLCANCGNENADAYTCPNGHAICPDCAVRCERCGKDLCVVCNEYPCRTCEATS